MANRQSDLDALFEGVSPEDARELEHDLMLFGMAFVKRFGEEAIRVSPADVYSSKLEVESE